jgi:uncharacterized membrane protein
MDLSWAHAGPSFLAGFFVCLVECVEALTVVLAVGVYGAGVGRSAARRLQLLCFWE